MKNRLFLLVIVVLVIILFSSCAESHNINVFVSKTYGFWGGLWHGITSGFSLIGTIFSEEIAVYAVNNSGWWYDFGFLWGVGASFWGTTKGILKLVGILVLVIFDR